MTKMISKSPERHTFQKYAYLQKMAEINETPDPEQLGYYDSWVTNDLQKENDPEWQKDNLEYDLRTTDWILEKVRASDKYAQNLYAALCNNDFIRNDVINILREDIWYCSWRYAGGIIANMQEKGDYVDWYCSGIWDGDPGVPKVNTVSEGTVTDEVRSDLLKLGWKVRD
jgi:hypothetical protein